MGDIKDLQLCVISAGGIGSRLKGITKNIPKPLFPINKVSCLERSIKLLKEQGISQIIVLTCYESHLFYQSIKALKEKYSVEIELFIENEPLGECGSLWLIKEKLTSNFLFLNADLIWEIDIKRFNKFHLEKTSEITLLTHLSNHPEDSDILSESKTKEIYNFSLKPHSKDMFLGQMNLGNAGIAIIGPNLLNKLPPPKNKKSLCHHILNNIKSHNLRVFSYNTSEYVKDMGTPKRLKQVYSDLKKGIVNNNCYLKKQKCLFVDRDNTLIECKKNQYINSISDLKFIDKNIIFLAEKSSLFNMVIMATNQPQISMGIISWEEVNLINSFIVNYCLKFNLKINSVALCPHHPHSGFKDEILNLKQDCFCRKPKPGMFLYESYLRNIDLRSSTLAGDSEADFLASKNAEMSFLDINSF